MINQGRSGVRLKLWPQVYAVVRLRTAPRDVTPFEVSPAPVGLVIAPGDITLLAPESLVDTLPPEVVEECSRGWRALTIDARFPLDTVGVLAAVGRALAEVKVPVMAFSSHATDHFLVPAKDLGRALAALNAAGLERFLPK
jgi:hypothetical protein